MQINRSHTCSGEEADIVILMLIRNSGFDSSAEFGYKSSIGFLKVRRLFASLIKWTQIPLELQPNQRGPKSSSLGIVYSGQRG